MLLIVLIIILLLAFGGGGGYYGYQRWGTGGGAGIFGTALIILVLLYAFGEGPLPRCSFKGVVCSNTLRRRRIGSSLWTKSYASSRRNMKTRKLCLSLLPLLV